MSGLTDMNDGTVEEFIRFWEAAFDSQHYRAMAGYYTQDAVLIGTHLDALHGQAAIEQFWRTASHGAHAAGLTRTVQVDEVGSEGGLAFVRGTVAMASTDHTPAAIVRYVTLWKRQPDMRWRIAVDISSAGPASRPAAHSDLP